MAVPKYDELFQPIMDILADRQIWKIKDLRAAVACALHLSDDDLAAMLPSGKQPVFANRVHWALFYMKKAQFIDTPQRGCYQLSAAGAAAAEQCGHQMTLAFLQETPAFVAFLSDGAQPETSDPPLTPPMADSPLEMLDKAYLKINEQLTDELLDAIMGKTPAFFEQLVVNLLVKMGYGGALENPGRVVGQSGDGGIDGIIQEDKLGFNNIYIQAKRWDLTTVIGRPEIQKFVGALVGQGATRGRGLFITTARFSDKARQYAETQSALKVVLVDGPMLARLMIEYGLGVSTQATYTIRKIDTDFFDE